MRDIESVAKGTVYLLHRLLAIHLRDRLSEEEKLMAKDRIHDRFPTLFDIVEDGVLARRGQTDDELPLGIVVIAVLEAGLREAILIDFDAQDITYRLQIPCEGGRRYT